MNVLVSQQILEQSTQLLIKRALSKSQTYQEYTATVSQLAKDQKTTGAVQTKANIGYTELNDKRMKRWSKTLKFSVEDIAQIRTVNSKLLFLVITESWCGDAAPSLPVMNKIAELNPNIELKIVLRDENEALMERFLTNGAKSIPKLLILNKECNALLAEWGPRPSIATQMAHEYKKTHGKLSPEFKQGLQLWYNKNKGKNILEDLLSLLPLEHVGN